MIVKTRKYQLNKNTYIKLALAGVLRQQWWVGLIVMVLISGYFIVPNIWWFIGTGIAVVLYLLFWVIQFVGVTQLEQSKMLFERLSYEINSQQVLIKFNPKQGMPIKWDQITRAKVGKNYILLQINKAQLIHLPYKIFNTDNERKFVESILKRKKYID